MLDRPKQTIHAAELFHANAGAIARACLAASSSEVVVTVVDRREMVFAGTWIIPGDQIQSRVPELDDGDWSLNSPPEPVGET